MRSSSRRFLRFSRFAAIAIAAALPALAVAQQATQTSLSAETHDLNGHTRATLSIRVAGQDGQPVSGPVIIKDGARQLAGTALDAQGNAVATVDLTPGPHSLRAVFAGDADHQASSSAVSDVQAQTTATPDFTISVDPASLSLTAGQTGTVVASITPVNASALTAPMFVTLSCSGEPDQSSCSFTPQNVEIQPNATAPVTSNMLVTTEAGTGSVGALRSDRNPIALAVLLPGAFCFAGFAFAFRRRRWLNRLALMGLVALITMLGTTACAPRYNYFNHGPPHNLPTPAGTYKLQITAQSSNGVTATTHSFTNFVLTVK